VTQYTHRWIVTLAIVYSVTSLGVARQGR